LTTIEHADLHAGIGDHRTLPMGHQCELTILMPCLNEAETLGRCIDKARSFLARAGIQGEVVVADNGSTDGSRNIAREHGARLIDATQRGYGNALMAGIRAAHGRYIIIGDSDDSYDFSNLEAFIARLREGYELVMGNRFTGEIKPGAMPSLHRYLGNPVLTAMGRLFFRSPCGDFHCGLRGFLRETMLRLDLRAPGMEFASEMVVKATLAGLRIAEVPTTLWPDGRSRAPHLRSWRDGWRHLRFLLLFSPAWLFLYPGLALFAAGLLGMLWLLPAARIVGGITFDVHTLFYASLAVDVGSQLVLLWTFIQLYVAREALMDPPAWFRSLVNLATFEIGLITGAVLVLFGVGLGIFALQFWEAQQFGPLSTSQAMRIVIPSGTAVLLGLQVMYGAFFISVLEIRRPQSVAADGDAADAAALPQPGIASPVP
jgi:glycosyltransferase involved in cell wall biosynthesis